MQQGVSGRIVSGAQRSASFGKKKHVWLQNQVWILLPQNQRELAEWPQLTLPVSCATTQTHNPNEATLQTIVEMRSCLKSPTEPTPPEPVGVFYDEEVAPAASCFVSGETKNPLANP